LYNCDETGVLYNTRTRKWSQWKARKQWLL
jgi:hypothetical protein